MKLTHFGCSFAVGNAIPRYIPGLKSSAFVPRRKKERMALEQKYNIDLSRPTNCGRVLALRLNLAYKMIAENGASNERILRTVLQANLKDTFVLLGFTSHNRREGLTTARENKYANRATRWQTWKMVGPKDDTLYKDVRFDPWVNKGEREFWPAIEEEGQIRTVIQILYLQNYFKANNIPFLMYNALYNGFDNPLTMECEQLLAKVDTTKYFKLQGNFSDTQHGFCLKNKLTVSDLDDHPRMEGHTAWARELLPMAKKIL